jgi:hypothetical protein
MKEGRWLSPRHPDRAVFERDFPKVHLNPLEASCPGCRRPVKLGRVGLGGRLAGWCEPCSRGVTA